MNRAKPDPYRLAVFLAIKGDFGSDYSIEARTVWSRWHRYALKRRVNPGTPRSFSNALRKIGCGSFRYPDRRTRYHRGLRLAPSWWAKRPDSGPLYYTHYSGRQVWACDCPMNEIGQPMIYKKRGLLPGCWVPAEFVGKKDRVVTLRELPDAPRPHCPQILRGSG